ncbi:MAG: CHASE3 domain-containing protein, partial [Alphaproteobacteria bacterium]
MVRAPLSRRAMFAPLALLVVLAVVTGSLALYQITASRQSRNWIFHSHQVIEAVQTMFSKVQDVESGTRGYLVSGDPLPLDDYEDGLAAFPLAGERLQSLTHDRPAQDARVRRLREILARRVMLSKQRVDLAQAGHLEEARTTNSRTGKATMDQARDLMAEVVADEQRVLAERTARNDSIETTGVVLALVAGTLAILGLVYLFFTMVRVNRGLSLEIEAREAAETARNTADQLYAAVFENAGDYLFVIARSETGEFTLLDGNRAFAEATGYPIERIRGRSIRVLQPGPLGEVLEARYAEVVSSGQPLKTRTEMQPASGPRVWESTMVPVPNEHGQVDRIVEVARDVTERERIEALKVSAQKMEAVGHLTGG